MALHQGRPAVRRLCVEQRVSVIDTKRGHVIETIVTALFPKAPEGSTPDALAVSPGRRDALRRQRRQQLRRRHRRREPREVGREGLHPDRLVPDRRRRHARRQEPARRRRQGAPDEAEPVSPRSREGRASDGGRRLPFPYIGTTHARVPCRSCRSPTRSSSSSTPPRSTATARTPTSNSRRPRTRSRRRSRRRSATRARSSTSSTSSRRTAPTTRCSATSSRATATRAWCMFGEKVTPNHHKLAEEFVLLDNLYCNGQVTPRRAPVVHDGLQHRLHRPRLAPDLLAAARASMTTTRGTSRTPRPATCGTPAPAPG